MDECPGFASMMLSQSSYRLFPSLNLNSRPHSSRPYLILSKHATLRGAAKFEISFENCFVGYEYDNEKLYIFELGKARVDEQGSTIHAVFLKTQFSIETSWTQEKHDLGRY